MLPEESPDQTEHPFNFHLMHPSQIEGSLANVTKNMNPVDEAVYRFDRTAMLKGEILLSKDPLPGSNKSALQIKFERRREFIRQILQLNGPDNQDFLDASQNSLSNIEIEPLACSIGELGDESMLLSLKDKGSGQWIVYNDANKARLNRGEITPEEFYQISPKLDEHRGFAGVVIYFLPLDRRVRVGVYAALLPKTLQQETEQLRSDNRSIFSQILKSEIAQRFERVPEKLSLLSIGVDSTAGFKELLLKDKGGHIYAATLGVPEPGPYFLKKFVISFPETEPRSIPNSTGQSLIAKFEAEQADYGMQVQNLEGLQEYDESKIGQALETCHQFLLNNYAKHWQADWALTPMSISYMPNLEHFHALYAIQNPALDCFIPSENIDLPGRDPLFAGIILGGASDEMTIEGYLVSPAWIGSQLDLLERDPTKSILYPTLQRLIGEQLQADNLCQNPGAISVEIATLQGSGERLTRYGLLCAHNAGHHLMWLDYSPELGLLAEDFGISAETFYPKNKH